MMKKLLHEIKLIILGVFSGLRGGDDQILHSSISNDVGSASGGIHKQIESNRLSDALLKGKVTQQTQELAYRTYTVDKESKFYSVYTPTLALKRDKLDSKNVYYDNSDNLNILTIQENKIETETVLEGLNRANKSDKKQIDFAIKVERRKDFTPRYRIEEYTKRLAVKQDTQKNKYILDFYVSKYPNNFDYKSKGFVREIEHILNDGRKSDVIDISEVSFITNRAYKLEDNKLYKFTNISFLNIIEYDGNYVIKFISDIKINGTDILAKFYSKSMAKKYETHAPRSNMSSIEYDPSLEQRIHSFVCAECGKKVEYCVEDIDNQDVTEDLTNSNVLEYMDYQMAEQTFGKQLCKECLQKNMSKLLSEYKS